MGHCEPPMALGYTPLGVSTVHSSYASVGHDRNRSTTNRIEVDSVTSGSSTIAGDRPVPDIVTELPGPKARAHVAFDEAWTSPSLPRAYPIVPVRGEGLTVEDIDGNLFLDFAAGIAVNSTGHSHPKVVAAILEQAAELIHFSASDFYLPIYPQVCREPRASRRSPAAPAPISGTPAPRLSRPPSSSRDTRPSARTSWRSSAPSTAGRTVRSR